MDHAITFADAGNQGPELRFIDAIKRGLEMSMEKQPNLILMGQDIAEYGGAFKITEGFVEKFGKERVRNTPICESAIIGTALRLSLEGYKSMVEMQFAGFCDLRFQPDREQPGQDSLPLGQQTDVVIRMPTGGGVEQALFTRRATRPGLFILPD